VASSSPTSLNSATTSWSISAMRACISHSVSTPTTTSCSTLRRFTSSSSCSTSTSSPFASSTSCLTSIRYVYGPRIRCAYLSTTLLCQMSGTERYHPEDFALTQNLPHTRAYIPHPDSTRLILIHCRISLISTSTLDLDLRPPRRDVPRWRGF